MSFRRLYVWMGGADDPMDVLRYCNASRLDIMRQPCVVAEVGRWQEHTKDREAALSRIARQNDDLRAEVERLRAELALVCAPVEAGGGAAAHLRAEVERLRAQLDAARAAWAVALGFAHGGIDQDVCLFCADVQAVTDALGGDA